MVQLRGGEGSRGVPLQRATGVTDRFAHRPAEWGEVQAHQARICRVGPADQQAGFFAQLDRAVRVPILAGAGAALILRGDTVLGALAVSGGMAPGQDDECAEAALTALAP